MQKHTYRTILIYAVGIIALFYIYPTLGWMMLSDDARQERLKTWASEDTVYEKPSFWRDFGKGVRRWAEFDRSKVLNLGLDLQGGIHMVVGLDLKNMDPERYQEFKDADLSDAQIEEHLQHIVLQRIRRRINDFEAKEPVIQALGRNQIQIQLPGEKDIKRATDLIMKAGFLTFNLVAGPDETAKVFRDIDKHFNNNFVPFLDVPGGRKASFYVVPVENFERVERLVDAAEEVPGLLPEGKIIAFSSPPNAWDDPVYWIYLMDEKPLMTGEGLKRADPRTNPEAPSQWQILFEFSGPSVNKFAQVTEENIGRNMAIVVDGVVCSAPVIEDRIVRTGVIRGSFTGDQAKDLSIALNSGSMPVQLTEEYTAVVGASLGADSIRQGVRSTIVGLIIVVSFMLLYYRIGGFIANIALLMNAVFVLAALAYFNATLTLPGIAGLILTIGMAVDANVLIFERIREELHNGKSLLAAIDSGYKRATVTILDANVTTLIAAAVLMEFGTGPIEGFAVTLSIGVCSSVFTALVVTRAIFDFLSNRKWLTKLTMMSIVKPETHIRFLERRNWAFGASIAAIVVGMTLFAVRWDDSFGVDFTNGTNMTVTLNTSQVVGIGEVRDALAAADIEDAVVQEVDEKGSTVINRFLIRTSETGSGPATATAEDTSEAPPDAEETETVASRVEKALAPLCAGGEMVVDKVETVGPAVGDELKKDARATIFFALLFVVVYLWFRFELKFAIGAVAALVHDVLVTIGLFALTGRQISMPVIAALLTIIGYSLNDTIVVFDRIREDIRLYRGRGFSYPQVMDMSINQTLSRTLLTSLTTLFVVVVLLIFGGDVINDFAFALCAGVIVGTYSSIFVASPLVYLMQRMQRKQVLPTGEDEKNSNRRKKNSKPKKTNA